MSTKPIASAPKDSASPAVKNHAADCDDLQEALLGLFQLPNYRPPVLPEVAIELEALTKRANASYADVVAVLQKDPLIVAGVLKMAQSSLYGGRLQSLHNAVQRLGFNTLRDVVWQVATGMRLFKVPNYAPLMQRVRTHSIFTAHAARQIATRAGLAGEHSFLCGLLHDMGICGTLIALAETRAPMPPLSTLLVALDGVHERAGAAIARLWDLAPEIVSAIEHHHRYNVVGSEMPVLSAVICVAENMAERQGFGVSAPSVTGSAGVRFDAQSSANLEFALKRLRLQGKEDELDRRGQELAEQLQGVLHA